jgi:hypothetical protein
MRDFARQKFLQISKGKTMTWPAVFDRDVVTAPPHHEPQSTYGMKMVVAQQGDHCVYLAELLPGTPVEFEPRCAADIHCLDIEKFEMDAVVGWVSAAQDRRIKMGRLPLCIVVVANEDRLTVEELWRVSEELQPAGAIFHSWPENCTSFSKAFTLLGQSIASAYDRSTALDVALANK